MKKKMTVILAISMLLTFVCCACADGPELTVLNKNYYEYQGYSSMRALYLAKVQNNTDTGFYIVNGSFILKDAGGGELASQKYMQKIGSRYLAPGEITFLSMQADIPEGAEVSDYSVEIIPEEKNYTGEDREIEVNAVEYIDDQYHPSIRVTVTNNHDEPLAYITIVYAVEDADGNIYAVDTSTLASKILGAHSTITFVEPLSNDVKTYTQEHGITLTQVEAYAFAENK